MLVKFLLCVGTYMQLLGRTIQQQRTPLHVDEQTPSVCSKDSQLPVTS